MSTFLTLVVLAFCTYGGKAIAKVIKDSADVQSWSEIWWRGAAVSAAFAVFGAVMAGSPTCEEQDNRGCISYANDGYELTTDERIARGGTILWKTMLGGTIGLLLLRREEEKEAAAQGRPVFPTSVKTIAGILYADPAQFAKAIQVYSAGLALGFDSPGSGSRADLHRTGKAITLAVGMINNKPADERAPYAAAFNKAKAEALAYISRETSQANIFRSGLEVKG